MRNVNDFIGALGHFRIAFAGNGNNRAAACLDFFQVAHDLVVDRAARNEKDRGRLAVHQCNRPVFHLGGRVAFRVDVADLFQLQGAFQSHRVKVLPAQVQAVPDPGVANGKSPDLVITPKRPADKVGHGAKLVQHPCSLDAR